MDAFPVPVVYKIMDDVHFPARYWWIFAPIKAAAAIGLLSLRWFPRLARLTTAMLTLYFMLAVAAHIRARNLSIYAAMATCFAVLFGTMAARGPAREITAASELR
jgi:hypothetical protein